MLSPSNITQISVFSVRRLVVVRRDLQHASEAGEFRVDRVVELAVEAERRASA